MNTHGGFSTWKCPVCWFTWAYLFYFKFYFALISSQTLHVCAGSERVLCGVCKAYLTEDYLAIAVETMAFSLLSAMTNTALHVFIKFEAYIWRGQGERQFGANCYIVTMHTFVNLKCFVEALLSQRKKSLKHTNKPPWILKTMEATMYQSAHACLCNIVL